MTAIKGVKLDEQTVNACKEKIQEYMSAKGKVGGLLEVVLKKNTTPKEVIEISAISRDKDGKKNPHQQRLENEALANFAKELTEIEDKIRKAKNFPDLFKQVKEIGENINGVGEMAIYDVSLRIGEYREKKLKPDKIYLHAGTKKGVKKLFKIAGTKFEKHGSIPKNELPEPFRSCKLTPSQLEDFFCIYKDELGKSGNKARKNCAAVAQNSPKSCSQVLARQTKTEKRSKICTPSI